MDEHLEKLRKEFDDVGLVDRRSRRSGGGYEIIFLSGKSRVFPNVRELRQFCHEERCGKIDWLEKGIYEWQAEHKRALKLLIEIKKDCLLAAASEGVTDKRLANLLLENHLFRVADDRLL